MTHPIIIEESRLEDGTLYSKIGWTLRFVVLVADLLLFAVLAMKQVLSRVSKARAIGTNSLLNCLSTGLAQALVCPPAGPHEWQP